MDGKPLLEAIGGYDPRLRGLKEVVFYADGSTGTLLYRHSPETIKGSLVGKVLKGVMELVSPDGQKEALDVLVEVVEQDKSILTIHKKGRPKAIVVKAVYVQKRD